MFAEKPENRITLENIYKKVDSYQIFKYYCRPFDRPGIFFRSELREEGSPSCHIIMYGDDWMYKDFGNEESYRAIRYVMAKYSDTYPKALWRINREMGLGLGGFPSERQVLAPKLTEEERGKYKPTTTVIKVKTRDWDKDDINYWLSYRIRTETLDLYNISPITHYWVIKGDNTRLVTINNQFLAYTYDYYWNEGIFRRKLYFPSLKENRFLTNADKTVVQGWNILPKEGGKYLFITKSFKDIAVLREAGEWAVAPNAESVFIPEPVLEKLRKRWENIVIWFDNDAVGRTYGEEFGRRHDLKAIYTPIESEKDPSDYAKEYSIHELKRLIEWNRTRDI